MTDDTRTPGTAATFFTGSKYRQEWDNSSRERFELVEGYAVSHPLSFTPIHPSPSVPHLAIPHLLTLWQYAEYLTMHGFLVTLAICLKKGHQIRSPALKKFFRRGFNYTGSFWAHEAVGEYAINLYHPISIRCAFSVAAVFGRMIKRVCFAGPRAFPNFKRRQMSAACGTNLKGGYKKLRPIFPSALAVVLRLGTTWDSSFQASPPS
ncbi:hypothetical protein EV363DRAFT_1417892 [Boletus edulis]|nr:hypothetical protein EV363DRAFT_1417892 [Boletus edulis]